MSAVSTLSAQGNTNVAWRRNSFLNNDIVNQINAAKPKSVFLDDKPTFDKQHFDFTQSNKLGLKTQGLQAIRRAAFATETNNEVVKKML